MTDKTDDILLSLSREQYEKYLLLSARASGKKINIDLPPRTEIAHCPSLSEIAEIILSIDEQAALFISQNDKKSAFFSTDLLSEKDKGELMSAYYATVNKISAISGELDRKFITLAKQKRAIEEAHRKSVLRYQAFLPYKLALGLLNEYKSEVESLERELISDVQRALDALRIADIASDVIISTAENIIPEFLSKSASATGAPPYPDLSRRELFAAARDLCARLRAQRSRLDVR